MHWPTYLQRYKTIVVATNPEEYERLTAMRIRWTKKLVPTDPSVVLAKYINPAQIRAKYGYWSFRCCDPVTQRRMQVPFSDFAQYELDAIHGTYQDQAVIDARDAKFQYMFDGNIFFLMRMVGLQGRCEERQVVHVGWEEQRKRYQEYLTHPLSPWHKLRAQVNARDKVCRVCAKSGMMDVHHLTYARIGQEPLDDLILLCRDCHAKMHGK